MFDRRPLKSRVPRRGVAAVLGAVSCGVIGACSGGELSPTAPSPSAVSVPISGGGTGSTPPPTSANDAPLDTIGFVPEPQSTVSTPAEPIVATHPLDGLTAAELDVFRDTLTAAGALNDRTLFPVLGLSEPPKADVLAWSEGDPMVRRVEAVAIDDAGVYRGIVNVTDGVVESWQAVPETRYTYVSRDFSSIATITADPRFVAGLERRGLTRATALCVGYGPGAAQSSAEQDTRLLRVGCFQRDDTNFWSRPVEGLIATYDLTTKTVIDVVDEDPVPMPAGIVSDPAPTPQIAPTQPSADVTLAGSGVRWGPWDFRWRMDRRVGLMINAAVFRPLNGEPMSVLYQGSMSEMYVPYQDPSPAWLWRTFMDSGEFGMGTYLTSLVVGVDCPTDAHLVAIGLPDESGVLRAVPNGLCVYERTPEMPSWRHGAEGSAGTELVVRTVSTVGNYDYVIDWIFTRDGALRVEVGAAGIVLQKAVAAESGEDHDHAHGTLVAPGVVGVNHDHFLSFRLDLDVGGMPNSFVREQLIPETVSGSDGRIEIWRRSASVVATEGAMPTPAAGAPERWLFEAVEGDTQTSRLSPRGYLLDPGDAMASPIVSTDDPSLRRAAWAGHPLWVTPYEPTERYAGGEFVLGSTGLDDGLAVWSGAGRSIENTDVVAWFTVGFNHVVRSEDVPIMPTHSAGFALVPQNLSLVNPLLEAAGRNGE